MFQFFRAAPSNPRWPPIKFEQKWHHRLTSGGAPMTSWGHRRPPAWGYRFVEVLWCQQGDSSAGWRRDWCPVPPSRRHRCTPELSSARCTPELSSVQGHDRGVRGRQGAHSQRLRFIKDFFALGFIFDRVELAENQEEMAACALCKKGVRQQFVARSNGSEYVRCSNRGCGYFCAVEDLPSYERVVQFDVASSFASR